MFYVIRVLLSLCCALCELYFAESVSAWFGADTASTTLVFLAFSAGMFNVSAAYLPQQFVLCLVMLSFGSFFKSKRKTAILCMGTAAIIGWPFILVLAVPMGMDCVFAMGLLSFLCWTASFGLALCALSVSIDSFFYGRTLLAPLNIVLYNMALSEPQSGERSEGQNLYGTEDWTFYAKNVGFNWNILLFPALVTPIFCLFGLKGSKRRCLLHSTVPLWCWLAVFTWMPHKEERFLFAVYPFIALNAAIAISPLRRLVPLRGLPIRPVIVSVFIALSLSRTIGQVLF